MDLVKQYGYYRSGTNFTKRALQENYHCRVLTNRLGPKHGPPLDWHRWISQQNVQLYARMKEIQDKLTANQIRVVVTVKDPYAWMDSFLLYRPPLENNHQKLRAFLLRLNTQLSQWERIVCHSAHIVRYEDLIRDYDSTLCNIGNALQLIKKNIPGFIPITQRVDPYPWLRQSALDHSYFLERRYLQQLSPEHIRLVTDHTDWTLLAKYGYYPLTDFPEDPINQSE